MYTSLHTCNHSGKCIRYSIVLLSDMRKQNSPTKVNVNLYFLHKPKQIIRRMIQADTGYMNFYTYFVGVDIVCGKYRTLHAPGNDPFDFKDQCQVHAEFDTSHIQHLLLQSMCKMQILI